MFYLFIAVICYSVFIATLTTLIIASVKCSFRAIFYASNFWWFIVIIFVSLFLSIISFNSYKQQVQSNAIDHYVVGDYELHEIYDNNGDIIDWYYEVVDADYDW